MIVFTWKGITFRVGEMNRAQALVCSAEFNKLFKAAPDGLSMSEVEEHVACYAPVVIQESAGAFASGAHTVTTEDGERLELNLPLTGAAFQALPYSLTQAWSRAAMDANPWLTFDLKNEESRITTPTSESPSGKPQS